VGDPAAAVGWCASIIATQAGASGRAPASAFWSALLYTVHPSRLLPAVWASASDSMMVLWTALALGCWLGASRASTWLALPLFAAALLSKEAAIMVPGMALVLWWWLRDARPEASRPPSNVLTAGVVAIAAVWLMFRINLTAAPSPESPYALHAGLNVFRNAAALTAFARSEDRARALRSGFQLHLAKPIDPVDLLAAVEALAKRGSATTG
jgi:hypothetical protein